MIEHRTGESELRLRGRRLEGVVVQYGQMARDRRERFEPGSLAPVPPVIPVNIQHDTALAIGELDVEDTPAELRVVGDVPAGVADLIRLRRLEGLSMEFVSKEEHDDSGVRVIDRAQLHGVGLVHEGAYATSVEVRQRSGRSIRTTIPENVRLACDCSGQDCDSARFETGAAARMLDEAFGRDDPLIAGLGSYDRAFAAAQAATIRRTGRNSMEIDVPDGRIGEDILQLFENVSSGGVLVRPYLDRRASTFTKEGGVAVYAVGSAVLRAMILAPTDRVSGWEPPEIVDTPAEVLQEPVEPPEGDPAPEPAGQPEDEQRRRRGLVLL